MNTVAVTLSHFLFPRHSNNHKAKLLHSTSLMLLALFLIFYQVILHALPLTGIRILGYAANIPTSEVINLTNQKRAENGVASLSTSVLLTEAARLKGEHMLVNDYWAHTAPDGTEPWTFFTDVGYKYRYAGENLARDFSNPNSAIEAWLASPSHRENMLSGKYKEIGVAVVEGDLGGVDTTIIVSFFGTNISDTTSQVPVVAAKPQIEVTPTPQSLATFTPTPPYLAGVVTPTQGIEKIITLEEPVQERAGRYQILFSPFESTKEVAVATTVLLLVVLIIDGIIVTRRNITRIGGRTFAHIAFLGMILAILLIAKVGEIL
ncbi:MAG: hypothetical protein UT19_C0004G0062 [Candidatus Woesebacteria bacterium GW2011_GWB1_39_10b]|uniref:SCP domain-containing protein n=3 Tax=Candidatus Woeseibacteriota TaxID=1752722 RepID=A0A0G0QT63_9BACT|nr:MAG: hypothetical protein US72_C0010G0004 [Microgenomates group bacterium GW2011_GWC1_38_12]KKQ94101.1 MAG: hypothetical protein UT19_C0004G0062 [Candidatus Woesebacteria bacterium GW2011_GWB1_39_10b]KKR13560.1 MAG: hypothetical protein UT40_C0014G0016 [Candidatus Woesebacteria bacterium GW2011_GWA1_39_21b]OGM63679.1 MAG: hypothetical protein A3A52_02545 [Candidatus Woesebacteria bacterium RIFCSPLOWO2_01_FULL_39_14]